MGGLAENDTTLTGNGKSFMLVDELVWWIQERERIRIQKEEGLPKPWSSNPVFRSVYFCNVHREDDKVTKWIRNNYTPGFFAGHYELAICAARIFNRPTTLERIKHALRQPEFNRVFHILEGMQAAGEKIWSGAYLITTHGQKMPKLDYCIGVLKEAHRKLPMYEFTCQEAWEYIRKIDGFGSFLAAQVVADLKNTKGHVLHSSNDKYIFVAPGPGSLRGLNWVYNGAAKGNITASNFEVHFRALYSHLYATKGRRFRIPTDAQDLQNCLCEFDKYMRVSTNAGRSKRKYPGV